MNPAVSIPQPEPFIPAVNLPAVAMTEIKAQAKRQPSACPEALKSLDSDAEDRWNQLSRTARQDLLHEFAADELVFQLQCQVKREKKNNLPYDDGARLQIWDGISTRLASKTKFTSAVRREKPVAPSAGDTLRQASALGCVTRSVEAYAILIGWVIPTIKDHRLLRLRAIKLMAWAEARKTAAGYEAGFSLSDVAHASELCPGEDLLSEAELQALYPPSSSPVGSEASDGPPTEKSKTQIPARVGRKKIHENTASKQKAYRTRKKALRNTPETMQNA
jgi:hypothetical protein